MKYTEIETQCYRMSQSWFFLKVFTLGAHKLRVDIKRNAYDHQSYARIERWDGTKWAEIHSKPISLCHCKDISYVQDNVSADHFDNDWKFLRLTAEKILTTKD